MEIENSALVLGVGACVMVLLLERFLNRYIRATDERLSRLEQRLDDG